MTRYANDPQYAHLERTADLISKGVVYHAVRMVREPGKNRPRPNDNMSAWLMGRKVA